MIIIGKKSFDEKRDVVLVYTDGMTNRFYAVGYSTEFDKYPKEEIIKKEVHKINVENFVTQFENRKVGASGRVKVIKLVPGKVDQNTHTEYFKLANGNTRVYEFKAQKGKWIVLTKSMKFKDDSEQEMV